MDDLKKEYMDWMYDTICHEKFSSEISYKKLFEYLHSREFIYFISGDENRYDDGIYLRYSFFHFKKIPEEDFPKMFEELSGPCSVLEMIIALSLKCEQLIMYDSEKGNRTQVWFWRMIISMGLSSFSDENFDISKVKEIVDRFLYRKYEPNGKGSLFSIRDCDEDMRKKEIWYQMNKFLLTIE